MTEPFHAVLAAASRGESEAIEELYRRYRRPVLGAVRRRLTPELRRRQDSMDVAQSVFADVLRALPRFEDRGEPAFRHWLYLKVENKVRDKLRRSLGRDGRRQERDLAAQPDPAAAGRTPSQTVASREERIQVRHLVDDLEPRHREILRLRIDEGLRFAEIARRLGLPTADAARMQFARCVGHVRRRWETRGVETPRAPEP